MQEYLYLSNDFCLDSKGNYLKLNQNLYRFLKALCLYYGSSIEGRNKAITYYTSYSKVLPLVISNKYHIYYLRTRSYKASDIALINYTKLLSYKPIDTSTTRLLFQNDIYLDIHVNYRIIKRQMMIMKTYIKHYFINTFNSIDNY